MQCRHGCPRALARAWLAALVAASHGMLGSVFSMPVASPRANSGGTRWPKRSPAPAAGARPSGRGTDASPLTLAAALAGLLGGAAHAAGGRTGQRRRCVVARRATTRAQWLKRVKRIEGDRAVFDVTIPKPLGLIPRDFPKRKGVGVAKINPGGNTDKLNRRVVLDGEEGMFVLEGDEVVAVNGQFCEGESVDFVGGLVKGSEGDTVTLKLARNWRVGPVKVIWEDGGEPKIITMVRSVLLRVGADAAEADVKFGCRDGFCSSCWHAEEGTNLIHRICKLKIPANWDNVQPLHLLRSDVFKKRTGMSVLNMLQVDGVVPPAPVGVDGNSLRKDMTANREAGGNSKTIFTIEKEDSGWYD